MLFKILKLNPLHIFVNNKSDMVNNADFMRGFQNLITALVINTIRTYDYMQGRLITKISNLCSLYHIKSYSS